MEARNQQGPGRTFGQTFYLKGIRKRIGKILEQRELRDRNNNGEYVLIYKQNSTIKKKRSDLNVLWYIYFSGKWLPTVNIYSFTDSVVSGSDTLKAQKNWYLIAHYRLNHNKMSKKKKDQRWVHNEKDLNNIWFWFPYFHLK